MWPLTRRYSNTWKCETESFVAIQLTVQLIPYSSPPFCLIGAALRCILWGKYPVLPWRGLSRAPRDHLLLPWGWQHVHHWAHGGEFWDTTGETHQTPASAQEPTWRTLPMERPQSWRGPGGVRGQVPYHTVRCFYKGTTPVWILSLCVMYFYYLPWHKNVDTLL